MQIDENFEKFSPIKMDHHVQTWNSALSSPKEKTHKPSQEFDFKEVYDVLGRGEQGKVKPDVEAQVEAPKLRRSKRLRTNWVASTHWIDDSPNSHSCSASQTDSGVSQHNGTHIQNGTIGHRNKG